MIYLALYIAFVGVGCAYAQTNWQRAWLLVFVCGVIQDPIRKLTPGSPVYVSYLVVVLFAAILFAAREPLLAHVAEFGRRFPSIQTAVAMFLAILVIAA